MNWRRFTFEGDTWRLMGFTALTKPLGLVTQVLIASYFGAGYQLDAYAFALFPVAFFSQTIMLVFSAVAIPQIIKVRETLTEERVHSYQNALALLYYSPVIMVFIFFTVAGDFVIGLLGSRLPVETKQLSSRMIGLLAIPGVLACVEGFCATILRVNNRFRVPAFLPVLNAAAMLGSLIALRSPLGIWALPAGYTISHVIQTPFIVAHALRTGTFRWTRPWLPKAHLGMLFQLSWMVILAKALLTINAFIDKWFATGLAVGSISSINYSQILMNFGQQLFTFSLVVVMFTRMSEYLARGEIKACDRYVHENLNRVANIIVPASLGIFVISPELVRVLFQRGMFDVHDAMRTSGVLSLYMLGLPALVINGVVTGIFQSLQRLREKVALAFQYVGTYVAGNVILVEALGINGLAISSSFAINLHLFLSLLVLHRFHIGINAGGYFSIIARAYGMALVAWLVFQVTGVDRLWDKPSGSEPLTGAIAAGAGKFAIIVLLYLIQAATWLTYRAWRRRARRLGG